MHFNFKCHCVDGRLEIRNFSSRVEKNISRVRAGNE